MGEQHKLNILKLLEAISSQYEKSRSGLHPYASGHNVK